METSKQRRDSARPSPARQPTTSRSSLITTSTSNRWARSGRLEPLKLFYTPWSFFSMSNDITILPIIDAATAEPIQNSVTTGHGSEKSKALTPKIKPNPPGIEATKLKKDWVAPNGKEEVVRFALDSNLVRASQFSRHCRFVFPPGTKAQGLVTLAMIRRMLAAQLGVANPLSIQLQAAPRKDLADHRKSVPKSRGLQQHFLDDRTPLAQILRDTAGWFRVTLVEYVRLDFGTLGIWSAITPNEKATVGELRRLAADICQCEPEAVALLFDGVELNLGSVRLKSFELTSKSAILVEFDAVECSSCTNVVARASLGTHITSTCEHERMTCDHCLKKWVKEQLIVTGWERLSCPECDQSLQQVDIHTHASKSVYARWEILVTRAALSAIPDFRWCLNPKRCDYGHIHDSQNGSNIFSCKKCGYRTCILCERPWHDNETCQQFKNRKATLKANEEASAAAIQILSKSCPQCQARIEKNGGCDHMTCRKCKWEFCWLCLADYKEIRKQGNEAHLTFCPYHTSHLQ